MLSATASARVEVSNGQLQFFPAEVAAEHVAAQALVVRGVQHIRIDEMLLGDVVAVASFEAVVRVNEANALRELKAASVVDGAAAIAMIELKVQPTNEGGQRIRADVEGAAEAAQTLVAASAVGDPTEDGLVQGRRVVRVFEVVPRAQVEQFGQFVGVFLFDQMDDFVECSRECVCAVLAAKM